MAKKRKRRAPGRPPFVPTLKMRQTVAVAKGGGMANEEIAIGLGISRPTLEKHFAHELAEGAQAKRLEVIQAMHDSAVNGNVTAQKAYIAMVPVTEPVAAVAPRVPAKGKKETAQAEAATAHHADPEWRDLLPGGVPAPTTKQ